MSTFMKTFYVLYHNPDEVEALHPDKPHLHELTHKILIPDP